MNKIQIATSNIAVLKSGIERLVNVSVNDDTQSARDLINSVQTLARWTSELSAWEAILDKLEWAERAAIHEEDIPF